MMASQAMQNSEAISRTAKAEGGPAKGSTSAQMQSAIGKSQNFDQAAQSLEQTMQQDPSAATSEVCEILTPRVGIGVRSVY